MHACSQDLRDRVLGALARGEGPTEIARRYEVSRMWGLSFKKTLHVSEQLRGRPSSAAQVDR